MWVSENKVLYGMLACAVVALEVERMCTACCPVLLWSVEISKADVRGSSQESRYDFNI